MVFVVKYRRHALLNKISIDYLSPIMQEIGERYHYKFDAIGMEPDHMHVVVGAAPRNSPSNIMCTIKSIVARKVFEDFPEIKDVLWGSKLWSAGGHIDTISEYGGLEIIKKYVLEQGRDKNQLTLKDF
jgi:putative transposase